MRKYLSSLSEHTVQNESKRQGNVCLKFSMKEEASRELNFNMSEALCDDNVSFFHEFLVPQIFSHLMSDLVMKVA